MRKAHDEYDGHIPHAATQTVTTCPGCQAAWNDVKREIQRKADVKALRKIHRIGRDGLA
jgi:hypothetical protein